MSLTIENGSVRLATTDFGGSGPDLVLMHGLGATRSSMAKVAELLTGWRVITMDLRSQGESTTANWDFPSAVGDLDAVIRGYGLVKPYVGGHSLGGMVALQYALAGHPAAGAINIDGWGPGIASRFPGENEALVQRELEKVSAGLPRLVKILAARSRLVREGTSDQVLQLLHGVDVVAWHREVQCPSLAFNAVAPMAGLQAKILLGSQMVRLQEAHRRGLQRDLAVAAHENPQLDVVEVTAGHLLIRTHPAVVAKAIDAFGARVAAA